MTRPVQPMTEAQQAVRRRVRRTALLFALVAVAVYVGFILTGVLGGSGAR